MASAQSVTREHARGRPQLAMPWMLAGAVLAGMAIAVSLAAVLAGLFRTGQETSMATDAGASAHGALAARVNEMAIVGDVVWAATEGGLVRWSADGRSNLFPGQEIGFPDDAIQTIASAPDGTLWIAGRGVSHVRPVADGVLLLDYFDWDDNLGTASVRTLLIDGDGTVWAGSAFDGQSPISWFDGRQWHHDILPFDRAGVRQLGLDVRSLLRASDGSLWIGLGRDGVLRWREGRWRHYGPNVELANLQLKDVSIRAIIEDDQGRIWFAASDQGLRRYEPGRNLWTAMSVTAASPSIRAITQFPDGSLWAAGDGWVGRSGDQGATWSLLGVPADGLRGNIGSLVRDASDRLWIGADLGGVSLLEEGVWRHLQPMPPETYQLHRPALNVGWLERSRSSILPRSWFWRSEP